MDGYIKSPQNDQTPKEKSNGVLNFQTFRHSTRNSLNNETKVSPESQDYLEKKKIAETFQFLISHLIVHQPENPIEYLYQLIDDCILFRSGLKDPPLLWKERHVESVFRSIDTSNLEYISLLGYKTAMKILGVRSYNPCPSTENVTGCVDVQTFRTEALKSLENELAEITNDATH
ncbi:EF-hand calcium-binding domain-containing protein 10 [Calliopsis andreniformis]|uniref:EF-hand calcium-binding domain-containing protein 10 n=1 Tax=Calliopsis andreniformis TaxID=337506 RepID=UPI003FCD9D2D